MQTKTSNSVREKSVCVYLCVCVMRVCIEGVMKEGVYYEGGGVRRGRTW